MITHLCKKTGALLLALTVLFGCMVWPGALAAETEYTTDFTGYTITAATDVSDFGAAYAKVVDSGDAAHGSVMKLTYTDNTVSKENLGFRFFSGTGTKEKWNNGTDFLVEFDYKVESLSADAQLRVMAGSAAWTGKFNSPETDGASYWGVAADLKASDSPTGWQRASIVVADCSYQNNNAIHVYMHTATPTAQGGTSILVDNVRVVAGITPASVTFDYGYDSKVEKVYGINNAAVTFPQPVRDGYTFGGWNSKADGTGSMVTAATFSGNVTYYAIWTQDTTPVVPATQVQDFEGITSADGFAINTRKPFELGTAGTNQTLKATIQKNYNGNFARPLWALQMKGATTPYAVEPDTSITVSFKVMAEKDTTHVGYMLDTVNDLTVLSRNPSSSAQANPYRTMQVMTSSHGTLNAAGNEVQGISLTAGQWVTITATIPSVVAHGTGTQYLVLAITDTEAKQSSSTWVDYDLHIDDVSVVVNVPRGKVSFDTAGGEALEDVMADHNGLAELPVPYRFGYKYTGWFEDAELTVPATSPYTVPAGDTTLYTGWEKDAPELVTLTQDFESVTSADGFAINPQKPFELGNSGGSQTLKATIQKNYIGNFARPLWAFQINGADTPYVVEPGEELTVTFKVMAEKDTTSIGYMLDTVNDLTVLDNNPPSSAQANPYRTMQVLSSPSHGTLNTAGNEVSNVFLTAGEWTTITVTIPSVTAHGTGPQYLVLAITDGLATTSNKNWVDYDLHIDDFSISHIVGGHLAQVTYDTQGGDPMDPEEVFVWTAPTAVAMRVGYKFAGWYLDAPCTTPATEIPCQTAVTLYAAWEETSYDRNVVHFEELPLGGVDFVRRGNAVISPDVNHTPDGMRSLCLDGISNAGYDRNQFFLINPATNRPYEFVKGESYTLTFWLYWDVQVTSNFYLNTWIWGTDDLTEEFTSRSDKNDKNALFEFDGAVSPNNETGEMVPGTWNEVSISFTPKNGKYMLVGMTNSAISGAGYNYYLDDMVLSKPIPATVVFDANGGAFDDADKAQLNAKGQFVAHTAVGLMVEGPEIDPYQSCKRFMGWATDKEGQNLFNLLIDVVPQPELILYAMWGDWDAGPEIGKLDKENLTGKEDPKYRVEIQQDKVWTGNAKLPILETGDPIVTEDADPVTYIPPQPNKTTQADEMPVWLIIMIVAAAVVIVGGGAVLALLLMKNRKPGNKEVL